MTGAIKRRGSRQGPVHFGMHVVDAHDQILGSVILVREDHVIIRQELGINQLVAIPTVAISGVIGGTVFLNLTPGEIEVFGRTLERRERGSSNFSLRTRASVPRLVRDTGSEP